MAEALIARDEARDARRGIEDREVRYPAPVGLMPQARWVLKLHQLLHAALCTQGVGAPRPLDTGGGQFLTQSLERVFRRHLPAAQRQLIGGTRFDNQTPGIFIHLEIDAVAGAHSIADILQTQHVRPETAPCFGILTGDAEISQTVNRHGLVLLLTEWRPIRAFHGEWF